MRPIKFRAWDEQNKKMYENVDVVKSGDESNDWICLHRKTDGPWIIFDNPFMRQQIHLMQFTGLVDKTGKEIFEGDIIIAANDDRCRIVFGEYDEDGYLGIGFFFETLDGKYHEHLCSPQLNRCYEVVGDIYSTPEPLKETSNAPDS